MNHEKDTLPAEKYAGDSSPDGTKDVQPGLVSDHHVETGQNETLSRDLQGRHMQMIAIGGSIGAGLFVGSGGSLASGGPASLLIGFIIVGIMMLCTVQALGELAVLYPVNGAFFQYGVRFIDPAWGTHWPRIDPAQKRRC